MFYKQYTLPYEPSRTAILFHGPWQCGYFFFWGGGGGGLWPSCPKKLRNVCMYECWNQDANALKLRKDKKSLNNS